MALQSNPEEGKQVYSSVQHFLPDGRTLIAISVPRFGPIPASAAFSSAVPSTASHRSSDLLRKRPSVGGYGFRSVSQARLSPRFARPSLCSAVTALLARIVVQVAGGSGDWADEEMIHLPCSVKIMV